jgi:putative inorganic carbon (hco3(-)) transporter
VPVRRPAPHYDDRVRPRETLAWIVVALLFIDLTFFSGASNFLASPQSRFLNQLIVVGAMVVAGLLVIRGQIDLRSPYLWPGIAWVVVTATATATSQRPAASIEALALLLICAPAYYLIRAVLADPALRPRMDWLIVVSTTVFVVAYLLQAFTQWLSWWSVAGPSIPPLRPGDVGLTVGTVNAVALYLELLVPIAVWLSWTRWHRRPFSVGLAVLGAFALLVTGSRGAWLGAAAGLVVLVALVWRTRGLSIARFGSGPTRWIVALVVVGGAILLVPTFVSRMLSGDAGRIELWTAAWSMFTSSPIVGVGPGAWPMLRAFTPISDDNLAVLATSHNSILQILAETGVIGLLAAAWLVVTIARVGWRAVTGGRTLDDRTTAAVALGSLAAAGVHSVVDTQFHLPAIVLLVLHLAARLELIAVPQPAGEGSRRRRRFVLGAATAGVVVGTLLLVPIDVAMVRASVGNAALDRGDPTAALAEFDAAVALHRLPAYRLGLALAARALGNDGKADAALRAMADDEPFTFALVQEAALAKDPAPLWDRADSAGPYDATASANLAVQRFPTDPAVAAHDLASAMVQVPTLVYSERPADLFDDAVWVAAQGEAIGRIGETDPVTAAAVALLVGRDEDAATQRAAIADGPETQALDLLAVEAAGGDADLAAARDILRSAPGSQGVQGVLWMLAFKAESQPLIDAVRAVSVPMFFNVPIPPMELVGDGRVDADYSMRLPRWPQAESGRNGPKRPYIKGIVTIEPVYRPKR